MDEDQLFELLRRGLTSFNDDLYLLEHDVAERAITAKLGCHLQCHLPAIVGEQQYFQASTEDRLHVDCEFNRFYDDTKWVPWDFPIVELDEQTIYYTPSPDIIVHQRGTQSRNVLVIEAKKEGEADNVALLLDKMKLIGYVGPNLNYAYGLYLCLGYRAAGSVVCEAELVNAAAVRRAITAGARELRDECYALITKCVQPGGRVSIRRSLAAEEDNRAGELCHELSTRFLFTDVRERLK